MKNKKVIRTSLVLLAFLVLGCMPSAHAASLWMLCVNDSSNADRCDTGDFALLLWDGTTQTTSTGGTTSGITFLASTVANITTLQITGGSIGTAWSNIGTTVGTEKPTGTIMQLSYAPTATAASQINFFFGYTNFPQSLASGGFNLVLSGNGTPVNSNIQESACAQTPGGITVDAGGLRPCTNAAHPIVGGGSSPFTANTLLGSAVNTGTVFSSIAPNFYVAPSAFALLQVVTINSLGSGLTSGTFFIDSEIPEPATFGLVVVGGLGLFAARIYKRKNKELRKS